MVSEIEGRNASTAQTERRVPYMSGTQVPPTMIIDRHESMGTFPTRTWPGRKAWTGASRSQKTDRSARYVRGRWTEAGTDECVVQLYANLAPDSSLSAEDTKPKAEAKSLPLTSNSHRAGRGPILLLGDFVILLLEVGHFLVFVMNRNDPRHRGGYPGKPGGCGDRWRWLESGLLSEGETRSLGFRFGFKESLWW